jgi:hypothetical protein
MPLQDVLEMDKKASSFTFWTFQFSTVSTPLPLVVQNFPIKISDLPWAGT